MKLVRLVLLALLVLCLGAIADAAPPPHRVTADLVCESFGDGPQLECTVRLARAGAPLPDARVTLGAHMPSMPMAHSVKPVAAPASGKPGEYRGALTLEMEGAWAVQVDVTTTAGRDRIVRTLEVVDCDADKRCPASAPKKR